MSVFKLPAEGLDSVLLMIATYLPGLLGRGLRYSYYKRKLKRLGVHCIIDQGAIIEGLENVSIGDYTWVDKNVIIIGGLGVEIGKRVHIGQNCLVQGGGFVRIGDYAGISASSMIFSATDTIHGGRRIGPMIPSMYRNPVVRKPVIIGKDAWIGAGSVILPGVTIGEAAVVGACSLVLEDVPPSRVAMGCPAKVVDGRPKITVREI